jgi:hypothetical protein
VVCASVIGRAGKNQLKGIGENVATMGQACSHPSQMSPFDEPESYGYLPSIE